MNFKRKHYICGFNGFQQIEQCMSQTQTNPHGNSEYFSDSSKKVEKSADDTDCCRTEKNSNYSSAPQEINTEVMLCTWSNVWGITGNGKLTCYGYDSSQVLTELNNSKKELPTRTVTSIGKDVLLQDNSQTVFIGDDGKIHELTSDVEHVRLVAGTKDHVYGVKEGHCYEGHVGSAVEDKNCKALHLHPILVDIVVQTVSCGFEHTLMLTKQGAVYSSGSGSRGQLGHGEVTVDLQTVPRCVDTFTGIFVVAVAAGGWHSTAVTDSGDVYVWGWNESGQLGLPNGTISTAEQMSTSYYLEVQSSSSVDSDRKIEKGPDSCDAKRTVHETVDIGNEIECSNVLSHKRKLTDFDEGMVYDFNKCTKCQKNLERKDCKTDDFCEDHTHHHYEPKTSSSLGSRRHSSDCVSGFEAVDSDCVPQKYYQSIDCVQVQTVPYGLDFPDELHVKSVSCGTRHTCILSDSGILLTSGWNSYGQLCHGDTESRDYFETVTYFTRRNEKVVNVKAEYWNTCIGTVKKCGIV